MTALVLEFCGGVCALSTIIFLAMLMVRKLEEELGPDLARSQAESFVAHLEQSGFFICGGRSRSTARAIIRFGAASKARRRLLGAAFAEALLIFS